MATMRDVAARAGVSAKTVSRVFNGDPHVLPETRQRIETIMAELNYVPNVLATTFRTGRASVIGVAVPDVVDPFFAAIAKSVDVVAMERGMSTLVTSLGNEPEREREILESLLSRKLSGLVIAPVGPDHSWMKKWMESTPIVFVDRAPTGLSADVFVEDDATGAYLATRALIDSGNRRIAYIGDQLDLQTELGRLEGYRRALEEAGLDYDEGLVAGRASDRAKAAEAVERLWATSDPPTAVFSSNARGSMLLVPVLRGRGVAYSGFGDFPLADVLSPSWTVVDQDPARLGLLAAQRILDRQEHPGRRFRRRNVLEVKLVERESSR